MWKETVVTYFNSLFGYSSEGAEENHETLSQDGWCQGRDSNRSPPGYKSETVPHESVYSVIDHKIMWVGFGGEKRGKEVKVRKCIHNPIKRTAFVVRYIVIKHDTIFTSHVSL
jgi:hypothetical protein